MASTMNRLSIIKSIEGSSTSRTNNDYDPTMNRREMVKNTKDIHWIGRTCTKAHRRDWGDSSSSSAIEEVKISLM